MPAQSADNIAYKTRCRCTTPYFDFIRGVTLSDRLKQAYPEEMTVVLQHEFSDLTVDDDAFYVRLSFGNIPETIRVPFNAVAIVSKDNSMACQDFSYKL